MARNARLRLPQNVRQIRHGKFSLGQKGQHAQTRLLTRCLERRIEGIETELSVAAHLTNIGPFGASSHYIRICLYVETMACKSIRLEYLTNCLGSGWH